MSGRRRLFVGTEVAGDCIGAGDREPGSDARGCRLKRAAFIVRMASDNPLWGTERIRGELLKLSLIVSARSIRRYRRPRTSRPPSLAWRTFLRNELAGIWAADLLVVQSLTFKTLCVLFFIRHQRRELVHSSLFFIIIIMFGG